MSLNEQSMYKTKDGHNKARYTTNHEEGANREIPASTSPLSGKTFKDIAEEYLEKARGDIASTTYDRYLDALERDVYPEYANTPMTEVTEAEVNRFIKVAPGLAEKRGRSLTNSGLLVVKAVMSNVINYANSISGIEKTEIVLERTSYEELSHAELEMVCLKAKHNHCPEMLAALLSIYCGMRTGELCALSSDDVDTARNEIYIHKIAHRVRNPRRDEENEPKSIILIEEISQKRQIRRVRYPSIFNDYISEFRLQGRPLIRSRDNAQTDPRTLENWLKRIMAVFRINNTNFERLRKTHTNGKADEQALKWSEYMSILFVIWNNDVGKGILEENDLFPAELKKALSVNRNAHAPAMGSG